MGKLCFTTNKTFVQVLLKCSVTVSWSSGNAFVFGAGDLRFKSWADQTGYSVDNSSVARGVGGLELPHWPEKYAKYPVFSTFEADFALKNENSPPQ